MHKKQLNELFRSIIKSFIAKKIVSYETASEQEEWLELLSSQINLLFVSATHSDKESLTTHLYLLPILKKLNQLLGLEEDDSTIAKAVNSWRDTFLAETSKEAARSVVLDYLKNNLSTFLLNISRERPSDTPSFFSQKSLTVEEQYNPEEELIRGTRRKNIHMVESALTRGADINLLSKQREHVYRYDDELSFDEFPLYIACQKKDVAMAKFLLNKGANPNMKCVLTKTTALFAANENLELVKLLIATGVEMDAKNVYGKTFLYEVVAYYYRLSPLESDEGKKPGLVEVALYLISQGACLDDHALSYQSHESPLIACIIMTGEVSLVKAIMETGVDISSWRDKQNASLLHYAAQRGHEKMVLFLLQEGLDIHATDNKDLTALSWCGKHSHIRELFAETLKIGHDERPALIPDSVSNISTHSKNHSTDLIVSEFVPNDYHFIWHVMHHKVEPIKTYAKERGAHTIDVSVGKRGKNFFANSCSSEVTIKIGNFKYDVCGAIFFYLLEGYAPKKEDRMRDYRDPGFFYAWRKDYYHIQDQNAGWPLKYEDGTIVSRSDFFMEAVRLFPEVVAQYCIVKNSADRHTDNEQFNAQLNQQVQEIYLHLLEIENPTLTRHEIEKKFSDKIANFPEIIVRNTEHIKYEYTRALWDISYEKTQLKLGENAKHMEIYNRTELDYPHYHHLAHCNRFREVIIGNGDRRYVSIIIHRSSDDPRWFRPGEVQEAFLVMINAAREALEQPLLSLTDIEQGMEVLLDPITESMQIIISDYEQLLGPYLEHDIRFDDAKYEYAKYYENFEIVNPFIVPDTSAPVDTMQSDTEKELTPKVRLPKISSNLGYTFPTTLDPSFFESGLRFSSLEPLRTVEQTPDLEELKEPHKFLF